MHINSAAIRASFTEALQTTHNFLVDNKKTILITALVLSALGLGAGLGIASGIYASGTALAKYAIAYHCHTGNFIATFAGLTPAGHTAVCAAMGAVASAITGAFAAGILMSNHSKSEYCSMLQDDSK